MEITTVLIGLLIVTIIISTIIILSQIKKNREAQAGDKSMIMLQNQLNDLTRQLDDKLSSQQKNFMDGLQQQSRTSTKMLQKLNSESTKTVKEVTEHLTKLDETNKRVVEFATQLQSLENILKNPKQRGILGEYFLEDLLSKVMPQGTYEIQYKFDDGEIVDAIIKIKDRLIPIDAKFSLEKYNQIQKETAKDKRNKLQREFKSALKDRIIETSKYIRPDEGTTDFALMFIPAEGIFYDLLVHKVGSMDVSSEDLINFAFKKRVILVSPNTFYAYLQTILQALNALRVEKNAKEIRKNVRRLAKHLSNYQEHMRLLGKHLGTTVSSYEKASHEFTQIDKDVTKIDGDGIDSDLPLIDKPDRSFQ
jgi:DNA recombination protein RmuC